MVKWDIVTNMWEHKPPKFFEHFRHDTYTDLYPRYDGIDKRVKRLCRYCQVWWYKGEEESFKSWLIRWIMQ